MTVTPTPASVRFPGHRFDSRWNRIPGITVADDRVRLDPDAYFFRLESATWTVIDWDKVAAEFLPVDETPESAVEQLALEYIAHNARTTGDLAEVLRIAWRVYRFLFRDEHLPSLGLDGVTADHLRMLAEVSAFTALNKVERDGHISVVGPLVLRGHPPGRLRPGGVHGRTAGRGLPRGVVQREPTHRGRQGPRCSRGTPGPRMPVRSRPARRCGRPLRHSHGSVPP